MDSGRGCEISRRKPEPLPRRRHPRRLRPPQGHRRLQVQPRRSGRVAAGEDGRGHVPWQMATTDSKTLYRISSGGPAWTRTRDLFLIRAVDMVSGCWRVLQNTCKPPKSLNEQHPATTGNLPPLVYKWCTDQPVVAPFLPSLGSSFASPATRPLRQTLPI